MDRLWFELAGHQSGSAMDLEVKGRKLRVPLASLGSARFDFATLCEQPLGSLDFLCLAHTFHTLFVDDIPVLRREQREVARRFVNLIDTLYDNRVCLIASAAAQPAELFPPGEGSVLYERTISRLMEMRSQAYLADRSERLSARVPA
jgi:cell division protein ZapE